MGTETTQKDLVAFFEIAADDQDRDGVHRFFRLLSDEALDNIYNTQSHNRMTVPNMTADVGVRVMNMLHVWTGRKISHIEHHAKISAEAVLNEMKDSKDIPDALVESCKDAWDYSMAQLGLSPNTTADELYKNLPKLDLKF